MHLFPKDRTRTKLLSLICNVLGEAKDVKQEEKGMPHVLKQLEDLHNSMESTQVKEEGLASLCKKRKAQEEALSMLDSLNKSLEAEKMARLETVAALEEAKQRGENNLSALRKERSEKNALQSALEVQQEEISRLVKERGQREQEANELREKVNEITVKLEASQHQVGLQIVGETKHFQCHQD